MRALLVAVAACSAPAPTPVHNAVPSAATPIVLTDDWRVICQQRLAVVADEFRHRAPSLYPDYAELGWSTEPEASTNDPFARVRIAPGRTWSFIASAVPRDIPVEMDIDVTSDAWARVDKFDYAFARHHGPLSLVVIVQTERSAMPLSKHPLAVAFVEAAEKALDSCGS